VKGFHVAQVLATSMRPGGSKEYGFEDKKGHDLLVPSHGGGPRRIVM